MRGRTIVQLTMGCALVLARVGFAPNATPKRTALRTHLGAAARCHEAAPVRLPPYPWPLWPFDRQHAIRGYFGDPRSVIYGPQRGTFSFHNGVDIVGWPGNRVYAVVSGHVLSRVGDEIIIRSPHGRRFQYAHVRPRVRIGQYVAASRTILGYLLPRWDHVHLSEILQGCAVNPLAPGHLEPYVDKTRPRVLSITFTSPDGTTLPPSRLHGEVEMVAQALDEPALPASGVWRRMPVTPARVVWAIQTLRGRLVVAGVTADFRETEPSQNMFCAVYAPGTLQNFASDEGYYRWGMAGRYRFRLMPGYLDTGRLPNGAYTLTVSASDTVGNAGTETVTVHVWNHRRVRIVRPPFDWRCRPRTLESR